MINLILKIGVIIRRPGLALIALGIFTITVAAILSGIPYIRNSREITDIGYVVVLLGFLLVATKRG